MHRVQTSKTFIVRHANETPRDLIFSENSDISAALPEKACPANEEPDAPLWPVLAPRLSAPNAWSSERPGGGSIVRALDTGLQSIGSAGPTRVETTGLAGGGPPPSATRQEGPDGPVDTPNANNPR